MFEYAPALAIAIPMAGALLIALTGRWPNLRETCTLVTAGALLAVVAGIVAPVLGGERPSVELFQVVPGISLALSVEPLGMIYGLLASFLWVFNSIYSIGYMRALGEKHQTRFYVCFAIAIASVMGIAFSANLLTLFLFYEILTFSTFPLVTHKGTPEALRSGRIYLGILVGTSTLLLLFAIVWTWHLTGSTDFREGGLLAGAAPPATLALLFTLFVLGTGKAAVMPFHFWLPAAMVAPTPVSALLHAVAVVKAGVFIVLKVAIYVMGLEAIQEWHLGQVLSYMASATILIGAIAAIMQDNLKARLAYSTISQLSYIVLAATLGTTMGAIGGGMHMVMHAFAKITLFFCAGAIYVAAKKTRVSELAGIGRVMPWTMGAFLVASLSNIGLPPFGGAWSKWYMALGTLETDELLFLSVYLVASLLGVAYLMPISIKAFFCRPEDSQFQEGGKEAPVPCLIALLVTATGCLILFVKPDLFYQLMTGIT